MEGAPSQDELNKLHEEALEMNKEIEVDKTIESNKEKLRQEYPFEEIYEKNANKKIPNERWKNELIYPHGVHVLRGEHYPDYKEHDLFKLQDDKYKTLVKKRYDLLVEYLSFIESIKLKYVNSDKLKNIDYAKEIIEHIEAAKRHLFNEEIFKLGKEEFYGNGDYFDGKEEHRPIKKRFVLEGLSPFGQAILKHQNDPSYGCVDVIYEMKPDIIFVLPNSAIFPSMILKETVEELKSIERLPKNYSPDFKLVPNKSYKYYDEGRKKYPEHVDEINKYLEKTILDLYNTNKNKVVIFDEFINNGSGVMGLKSFLKNTVEKLKRDKQISDNYKLEIDFMSFQSEYFTDRKGGIIQDYNFKGGSKLGHWVLRHIFHKMGQLMVQDWNLIKEVREKAELERAKKENETKPT